MPVPATLPDGSISTPKGFSIGVASANLKDKGVPDIFVVLSALPCSGAGVFTQNRVQASHVVFDRALLLERPGRLRGVIVNSHIANACTGSDGLAATATMADLTEAAADLPRRSVLALSTGVIGEPLPMDRVGPGIRAAVATAGEQTGLDAARAIMTTDRTAKHVAVQMETATGIVTIGGIAKGSAMIHPNMATILGLITTDAEVDPAHLGQLLRTVADRTFNAITVDGGTSPNDTVLMLANGASKVAITRDAESWKVFQRALEEVARALALMIVRDGDGATKFIELTIMGASTSAMARSVGRHIGSSIQVKTSLGGGETNWGRILAAAGSAGFPVDPNRLKLSAQQRHPEGGPDGDWVLLASEGGPVGVDGELVDRIFSGDEIALRLDLAMGSASATVWTCDLSEEYVRLRSIR